MGDLFFEIVIKDDTYRKVGTWKFQKKDACKRLKDINSIFGLGIKITDLKEKEETKEEESDKDLNWLR